MRVVHVLTYLSPNMDFGGPARVAINLSTELRRRGHDVIIAGGARGYGARPPDTVDGVPAVLGPVHQLLPLGGVNGLANPVLSLRIAALLDAADVVHAHFVRDLVVMPAALAALRKRKPLVLQCHGMLDPSQRLLSRPLDALITRRLVAAADMVLYLTEPERRNIERVVRGRLQRAHRLPNGVPEAPTAVVEAGPRDDRLVLFAARVHAGKRPEAFVEAAALVTRSVPDARFVIVGPDGGCLAAVNERIRSLGLENRVQYVGPASRTDIMKWFVRSAVYVLPSIHESFGMTALEAMSVGTPVVVTDSCGLAEDVAKAGAGVVVSPDPVSLATGISSLLLEPRTRENAGIAGRSIAAGRYGIAAVVDELEVLYNEVMSR